MAPYPKAVILAGGSGSRLGILGQILPKCLLPVFDKPLLVHQIEQCAVAGVAEILVSTSAQFEGSVRSALSLYTPPPGITVSCAVEPTPLGPILGFLSLLPWTGGQPTLVLLGDEYYEHSSPFLALARRAAVPDVLLGVVADSPARRILCSVVIDEAGRVVGVREKPAADQRVGGARWCGLAAFAPAVLAGLEADALRHRVHFGDLLSFLVARGACAEAFEIGEIHLNLNTADDALLASLVEARRRYRRLGHPLLPAIERALEGALQAV